MQKRKFKEAAEAYEVLRDPQKRVKYDQYGHAGVNGQGGFGGAGGIEFDMEDIFSRFGDIFGGGFFGDDIFGGGRGRSRGRRQPGTPGSDMKIRIPLPLRKSPLSRKNLKGKKTGSVRNLLRNRCCL